jgi:hypothetical protein
VGRSENSRIFRILSNNANSLFLLILLRRNFNALTKTKAIIVLVIVIGVVASIYLVETIVILGGGYPPFCSGYLPGGNCHSDITYDFTIVVNYSGSWKVDYRGFHNGENSTPNSDANYTGGEFSGEGYGTKTVTISGDNYYYLQLCATAHKLGTSDLTLTLSVIASNSTSLPYGSISNCGGVAV